MKTHCWQRIMPYKEGLSFVSSAGDLGAPPRLQWLLPSKMEKTKDDVAFCVVLCKSISKAATHLFRALLNGSSRKKSDLMH
jgi:hypothetical protein